MRSNSRTQSPSASTAPLLNNNGSSSNTPRRKLHQDGISHHRNELATHNRRLVLSRMMDKVVDRSIRDGHGNLDYEELRDNFEEHLAARHRFHEDVEAAKKEQYKREALRRSRFMASTSSSAAATTTAPAASSAAVRAQRQKQEREQERLRRTGGAAARMGGGGGGGGNDNDDDGIDPNAPLPAHIQRIIDEDNAASGHPGSVSHYTRRGLLGTEENFDEKNNNAEQQQNDGGDGMGSINQLFSVAPTFLDQDGNPAEPGFGRYAQVVSVQGGSLLWAAMDTTAGDGGASSALQLIDGTDGRVLHTVDSRAEETGPCTCLFAANPSGDSYEVERTGPCFIWAGFADGTVRIFDALIATPVTEGRFHDGAVLAFCASHNGRVFSAGQDGTLIRWNTEATCFEAMSKIVSGHTGMITGLAATRGGKTLFSVSEDGTLREYNVVDGRLRSVRVPPQPANYSNNNRHFDPNGTNNKEANGSAMSAAAAASSSSAENNSILSPLRAVCTIGDLVVSGGDTGELHIWISKSPFLAEGPDADTAAQGLDGTAEDGVVGGFDSQPVGIVPPPNDSADSAVLSLAVDPVLSHVWVGRLDGLASCYVRHRGTTTLSLVNAIVVGRGVPIRCLHAFCCIDTTTTWTVGSDGMNFLWHSSRDRARTQADTAMASMQSVAEKDARELEKWREALQRLNQLRLKRTRKLAAVLEFNYIRGVRLFVMSLWRRYRLVKLERRMRLSFGGIMCQSTASDTAYRYFLKWYWWSRLMQRIRLKEAFTRILDEDAMVRPRALPLFVAKLQSFVCRLREAELRRNLLVVLRNTGRMGCALRAFRVWSAWAEKRREWIRRDALRHALGRTLSTGLLRRYYQKWLQWNTRTADRKNKIQCMQLLMNQTGRGSRRYYFIRWRDHILSKRARAQKMNLVKALGSDMDRARMLHAFVGWKRWRLQSKRERLERRGGFAFDKDKAMQTPEYQEVQMLLQRKRDNDEIEREIMKLRNRQMNINTELAYGQRVQRELEQGLAIARAESEARKASMAEKMSNIIARMKAKLLNFSSDVAQVQNITDKSKSLEARKIFLEAHATVKRIVVDIIKDPHHPTDKPWPITQALLQKIPSHAVSQLNNAIKAMIVTFDLMPREQRMNLSSDEEIILNGQWLIEMAALAAKAFVAGPKR